MSTTLYTNEMSTDHKKSKANIGKNELQVYNAKSMFEFSIIQICRYLISANEINTS